MSETQTVPPLLEQPAKTNHHKHPRHPDINLNHKKKQRNAKNGRKRSKSFSGGGGGKAKKMRPVLPTRFLLGGNIHDPLNLNSLQDEEVNRAMNAVTPKSSPIPTPPCRRGKVQVIIPANINDPLHLIDCSNDADYEQQLCTEQQLSSPMKKCRKKRVRKRRTCSGTSDAADMGIECAEARTPENNSDAAKIPEMAVAVTTDNTTPTTTTNTTQLVLELASPKKPERSNKRKSDPEHYTHKEQQAKKLKFAMDKIVSPVVPQPGSWFKRSNSRRDVHHKGNQRQQNKGAAQKTPTFKDKNKLFQYGNYNRYYGYRNQHSEVDLRLLCFASHRSLFEGKDILDIGCNIGHITLSVARDFGARNVTGVDIDRKLIDIARKNVKHYVKTAETPSSNDEHRNDEMKNSSEFYPISMPILYGPVDIPGFAKVNTSPQFPNNVTFKHGNYVLDDDALLSIEQPQFDVILCLSITKWIHLNWGDSGIKRVFKRMYSQLRPGGKLILEPQNFSSYKIKKKLTETIYKNYNTIQFFPNNFTQYLLSAEVGFAKSEVLGFARHQVRGFQRPIQVYTKSSALSSERTESGSQRVASPITIISDANAPPTTADGNDACTANANSRVEDVREPSTNGSMNGDLRLTEEEVASVQVKDNVILGGVEEHEDG